MARVMAAFLSVGCGDARTPAEAAQARDGGAPEIELPELPYLPQVPSLPARPDAPEPACAIPAGVELGTACGTCGEGLWQCGEKGAAVCVGDESMNACGGCEELEAEPGDHCGKCDLGFFECADGALQCRGDGAVNGCGGCTPFVDAAPGDPCDGDDADSCFDDVLACDDTGEHLVCTKGEASCGECRIEEATITSNAEADALVAKGCTHVGKLHVTGDIDDLHRLSALESIEVLDVRAVPMLRSLEGVSNALSTVIALGVTEAPELTSLKGAEQVKALKALLIRNVPKLESLDGLDSLERVDESLELRNLPTLNSVRALERITSTRKLVIYAAPRLSDLTGLGQLAEADVVQLSGAMGLTSLSGLSGLRSARSLILGGSWASDQPDEGRLTDLTSLPAVEVEHLLISGLDSLSSLAGVPPTVRGLEVRNAARLVRAEVEVTPRTLATTFADNPVLETVHLTDANGDASEALHVLVARNPVLSELTIAHTIAVERKQIVDCPLLLDVPAP